MSKICECGCGLETNSSERVIKGHFKFLLERLSKEVRYCQCGCGGEIRVNLKGTFTSFIHGHNKGHNMPHSVETKEKISNKSKELFAIPEFKEKFKIMMKKRYSTDEAREANRRRQNQPEVKAKIISGIKRFYEDPTHKEIQRQKCKEAQNRPEVRAKQKETISKPEFKNKFKLKMIEIANKPDVKEKRRNGLKRAFAKPEVKKRLSEASRRPETQAKRAATLARNYTNKKTKVFNTEPERIFVNEMIKRGYILGKTLIQQFHCKKAGMIDAYLPEKNALIEVDGDYWHCHPDKYSSDYFHKKIKMTAQEIWERDKKKTELCISLGYKIIRFWESDIYKDINVCISKLENELIK